MIKRAGARVCRQRNPGLQRPVWRAWRWAALGCLLAAALPLASQTKQEHGKQLVEQALDALGGEAFLQIRNVVKTGRAYSFYREDLRGLAVMTTYELYEPMRDDAGEDWLPVSRREVYTEKGDYYSLFQNGRGWEVTYRGARPLPEERLQRYRESTRRDIFYFFQYRMNEPGLYYYYRGIEIIDNVPTDVVDITDSESNAISVYLRRSDHLPVQQIYTRRDPKTRIPYEEKSVFSKYRRVGQVMLPWNVRHERDREKIFEFFGASIEVNQALEGKVFSLESGIDILPENP